MKNKIPVEISVKTIFTGKRSAEQVFVDLIRRRGNAIKSAVGLEASIRRGYTGSDVVFPGVYAPRKGNTL